MRSRRLSGCQLVMVTARGAVSAGLGLAGLGLAGLALAGLAVAGLAVAEVAAVARLRSVTAKVPGAAGRVCRPAPRVSVPPGLQSRTCRGRNWLSSPSVPLTDVR